MRYTFSNHTADVYFCKGRLLTYTFAQGATDFAAAGQGQGTQQKEVDRLNRWAASQEEGGA